MSTKEDWQPDHNAYIMRWVEEAAESGEIDLRAKRLGISYGDAMISLAEELEKPYKEREEKYRQQRAAAAPDEEEIDRRAQSYAAKNGVSYIIALDAVLGTTPGERQVELTEAPLRVDTEDEDLNHKVEARVRREGVSYEVALEAVLQEEEVA